MYKEYDCPSVPDLKWSGYPVSGSYDISDYSNRISGPMNPDGSEQSHVIELIGTHSCRASVSQSSGLNNTFLRVFFRHLELFAFFVKYTNWTKSLGKHNNSEVSKCSWPSRPPTTNKQFQNYWWFDKFRYRQVWNFDNNIVSIHEL